MRGPVPLQLAELLSAMGPPEQGSQTFALQVQHDGQRVPLQHLLAFVIQLNSQCGSPAFLDKGKNGPDEHWSYKISPCLLPTGQGLSTAAWDLMLQLFSGQAPSSPFLQTFLLLLGRMALAN